MKVNIIMKFNLEGFHYWKDAKDVFPEVDFLSDNHRHQFFFDCRIPVNHDDRDKEIILTQREIIEYLYSKYGNSKYSDSIYKYLDFGGMSCEMIARELTNKFNMTYCSVLEDNENGAEIIN